MSGKLTWAKGKRVTWAEAERVCPGIEAEWRSMLGTKYYTEHTLDGRRVRLPSPMPKAGQEWRVELHESVRDNFDYSKPESEYSWMVEVIQLDPTGYWYSPPTWRRWPSGYWTSPIPMPRQLLSYTDFRYDAPVRTSDPNPGRWLANDPNLKALLDTAAKNPYAPKQIYPMTPTRVTPFADIREAYDGPLGPSGSREE